MWEGYFLASEDLVGEVSLSISLSISIKSNSKSRYKSKYIHKSKIQDPRFKGVGYIYLLHLY